MKSQTRYNSRTKSNKSKKISSFKLKNKKTKKSKRGCLLSKHSKKSNTNTKRKNNKNTKRKNNKKPKQSGGSGDENVTNYLNNKSLEDLEKMVKDIGFRCKWFNRGTYEVDGMKIPCSIIKKIRDEKKSASPKTRSPDANSQSEQSSSGGILDYFTGSSSEPRPEENTQSQQPQQPQQQPVQKYENGGDVDTSIYKNDKNGSHNNSKHY